LKYSNPYSNFLRANKGRKCQSTGKKWTNLTFGEQVKYYQMTITEINQKISHYKVRRIVSKIVSKSLKTNKKVPPTQDTDLVEEPNP